MITWVSLTNKKKNRTQITQIKRISADQPNLWNLRSIVFNLSFKNQKIIAAHLCMILSSSPLTK